jgi:hypothetical protein
VSKAPTKPPRKASAGSRALARRQKLARQRAARRRGRLTAGTQSMNLRTLLRRVPRAGWIIALIAVLNATAWSVIVPPFQGRDEVDHFAYVERLAETGNLPHRAPREAYSYSAEESLVMEGLHYGQVRFTPYMHSISTVAEQEALEKDAAAGEPLNNNPTANGATSQPPLFYAIQSIPYALGGSNILVKLQLMRLLDALLGGITALLIFFFLRETVPRVPWVATVAAICVALQPLFAFVTGSLNPDALLYVLSAATFLCLARGFRRKLTIPLALALGGVIVAGFLTYYSFIGVAVGAFAGLVILAIRDAWARKGGRQALIAPASAIGVGISPVVIYVIANVASKKPTFGAVASAGHEASSSIFNEFSYAWQLFLPRLPGMTHYFAGITTWREIWFDRSVGLYGWMDTMFPVWVQNLAFILAIGVALLCARELFVRRREVKARLPELASYALITVGVMAMLGIASYKSDVIEHELAYGEPRYLLPMLPLFAAAIALAIRGAGHRWIPLAGTAMILLFLGHDIFSQLQVIARYYG